MNEMPLDIYTEEVKESFQEYEEYDADACLWTGAPGRYDYLCQVQYPFGYGLSYTNFEWSDYSVSEKEAAFEVSAKVKNTGDTAG